MVLNSKKIEVWVCAQFRYVEDVNFFSERWRAKGFRVCASLGQSFDDEMGAELNVDLLVCGLKDETWAHNMNRMLRYVVEYHEADYLFATSSDAWPDPRMTVTEYIDIMQKNAPSDMAIMQTAVSQRSDAPCAHSCHMMTPLFAMEWNGGDGPYWPAYVGDGYAQKELNTIAAMRGKALFTTAIETMFVSPRYMPIEDKELFEKRSLSGYPGHEPITSSPEARRREREVDSGGDKT